MISLIIRKSRSVKRWLFHFRTVMIFTLLLGTCSFGLIWRKYWPEVHAAILSASATPHLNYEENLPPILKEFCNREAYHGLEGRDPPIPNNSSYVVAVVLLTRHGDRTPMFMLAQPYRADVCNRVQEGYGGDRDEGQRLWADYVKYIIANAKGLHLQRGLRMLPAVRASSTNCFWGQMTPTGTAQMLKLGAFLRSRYLHKDSSIATRSTTNQTVMGMRNIDIKQIITTRYPRTFQSALALLHGLVPEVPITKIYVDSVSDVLFCNGSKWCNVCPLQKQRLDQMNDAKKTLKHSDMRRLTDGIIRNLDMLKAGFSAKNVRADPKSLADILSVYSCHAAPLPCFPNATGCPTNEDVENIFQKRIRQDHKLLQMLKDDLEFRRYTALRARAVVSRVGEMLELVLKKLNDTNSKPGDPLQFFYMSGHDMTLTPFLDVLGQMDIPKPPFASRLVFEVWKNPAISDDSGSQSLFLRLLYNGRDITSATSFCSAELLGEAGCGVERFVAFWKKDLLLQANLTDLRSACFKSTIKRS